MNTYMEVTAPSNGTGVDRTLMLDHPYLTLLCNMYVCGYTMHMQYMHTGLYVFNMWLIGDPKATSQLPKNLHIMMKVEHA